MDSRIRFSVMLMLLSVSLACSSSIDRTSLVGKYTGNSGKAVDQIELREDGLYSHDFSRPGKIFHDYGRWNFHRDGTEPRIAFHDYIYGNGSGPWPRGTYVEAEVKASWMGKLRLSLDPDSTYHYMKQ
jgi:hypothetical protein